MANKNPNKIQRRPQNTSKTPQTRTASEEKTTKTNKFPWKPPETHLIFSKTHKSLPFTFTTNENPTKHNGDHKTQKNTSNKNRIKLKNERKTQKPKIHPKCPPKQTWCSPKTHNLHLSNKMTNMNPTKIKRITQNTSKTPQIRTASEEKTTKIKKFPRKTIESHLIFSKSHYPLRFNFTTNENLTKPNGDTKTRQKEPQKEQDHPQKWKKNPKAIDPPQKSP